MNQINEDPTQTQDMIIIMAGGSGTRMKSNIPKQLMLVGKDPMIVHLLKNANYLRKNVLIIISEANKKMMMECLVKTDSVKWLEPYEDHYKFREIECWFAVQPVANGTGGALMVCADHLMKLNSNNRVVVLSADVPLISSRTIEKLFEMNDKSNQTILCKETKDNYGYGRVVLNSNNFDRIVEQKDCTEEEKLITLVNTGTYCFRIGPLLESLTKLTDNNAQKEYYITDCARIINEMYPNSVMIQMIDPSIRYDETMGCNTPEQLEQMRNEFGKKFTIQLITDSQENMSNRNLNNLMNCLQQLTDAPPVKIGQLLDYFQQAREWGYLINVVLYEDRIIGTGTLLVEQKVIHEMGRVGHIEDIVIDRDFRGYGLGDILIKRLTDIARINGCYKQILDCSDDVKPFYEKLGFHHHSNCMRMNL